MRFPCIAASGVLCLLTAGALNARDPPAEQQARKTMDEFMAAFNARDPHAWAATLNYPHVRFASGEVKVYNSAEDFARDMNDYPKRLSPGITAVGNR